MAFDIRHLYHAGLLVPDLEEVDRFFARVFGRESFTLVKWLDIDTSALDPSFPVDYCRFIPIAEVLLQSIEPARHRVDGIQVHSAVTEPRLGSLAWFVDGVEDLWRQFRSRDMKTFDLARREPAGDQPPRDVGNYPIIFTAPSDTGLEYEFATYLERRERRGEPPAPAVSADDPLGIERCAHHTILTDQLDRARRLYVDMLGGHVIHEGHNEVLGTRSSYIGLADAVIEFAEPLDDGSPAQQAWQRRAPADARSARRKKAPAGHPPGLFMCSEGAGPISSGSRAARRRDSRDCGCRCRRSR